MRSKVTVMINDSPYTLVAEEDEAYVKKLAENVDYKIHEILAASPNTSALMATVLTSINFCDEYQKAQENCDNLRVQLKDYLEELTRVKLDLDDSRRENSKLVSEIQALRVQLGGKG